MALAKINFRFLYFWLALAVIHGVMFFWFSHYFDIPIIVEDSYRFFSDAEKIAALERPSPTEFAFFVPAVMIAVDQAGGMQGELYLFIQIAMSLCAAISLFHLVKEAGGSDLAAMIGACGWSCNPVAQFLNVVIVSDGLYQSLLVISCLALVRWLRDQNPVNLSWLFVLGTLVTFSRPQGRLFPFIIAGALVWDRHRQRRRDWLVPVSLLVCLTVFLFYNLLPYSHYMMQRFRMFSPHLVWGDPDWHSPDNAFASALLPALRVVAELVQYHWTNSLQALALRILLAVCFYGIVTVGFLRAPYGPVKVVALLVLAGHLSVVALTHAEPFGRWFFHLLPIMLVWPGFLVGPRSGGPEGPVQIRM